MHFSAFARRAHARSGISATLFTLLVGAVGAVGTTAGCATGTEGGTGAFDDAAAEIGGGDGADGSLGDADDATAEGGDTASDAPADLLIDVGDATALDLIDVCVLGKGGPKGPCDPSKTIDFGSVGATASEVRLVRIDDRGVAPVNISSVATDSPSFTVSTILYTTDASGVMKRVDQALPYLIPSGQSLYAELTLKGTGVPGPLPADKLRIKAALGVDAPKELDVPITGAFSDCPAGRGSCDADPTKICTTDIANDLLNCGGCGAVCSVPHGAPSCVDGKCKNLACDTNYVDCNGLLSDGCETNVFTSLTHCGDCVTDCTRANTSSECSGGHCKIDSCAVGHADCNLDPTDGCETDVNTSMANCGGCNKNCAYANAAASCGSGVCSFLGCLPGFVDCNKSLADGCEANTPSDPNNCGGCGNVCTYPHATPLCSGGSCEMGPCATDFQNCDGSLTNGCESYAPTDTANCGKCGNDCTAAFPNSKVDCKANACENLGCIFGFFDKDGLASNGCEYGDPSLLLDLCVLNGGGPTGVCVTPKVLDFGSLSPGDHVLRRFRYTNISASDITIDSVSIPSSDFSPAPLKFLFDPATGSYAPLPITLPLVLHAKESLYFEVTLTAGTSGGPLPADKVHVNAHMFTEPAVELLVNMGGDELGCPKGKAHCPSDGPGVCGTNVATDTGNCGGCGITCGAANAAVSCVAGTCAMGACMPGFLDCNGLAADGCEVNIKLDPLNCGSCGALCTGNNAAEACSVGTCKVTTCTAPWADCNGLASDGCEVDTSSSDPNCGTCGAKCAPANAAGNCVAGACTVGTCKSGFEDCDLKASNGCEVDIAHDINNCTTCGNVCAFTNAAATCGPTGCALGACNTGFQNCDTLTSNGCEDYVPSDPKNCGACGHDCNGVYPHSIVGCSASTCTWTSCAPGYKDNNGTLTDGCEYASPSLFLQLCVENDGGPTGACAASKSLDFGSIAPGVTPLRLFKLTNTGDQAVLIDKVTTDASSFAETPVAYVTLPDGSLSRTVVKLPYTIPVGGSFYVESSILGTAAAGALPANKVRVTAHIGTESSEELDVPITGNMPGCTKGTASCDGLDSNGCEVNTDSDLANCGACKKACAYSNATTACNLGTCDFVGCVGVFKNCDGNPLNGCESNSTSDPKNCAGCGNSCAIANTVTTCASSACSIVSCASGYTDCDKVESNGCEVLTGGNDNANCGGCKVACAPPNAAPLCVSGGCNIGSCNGNFLDCNKSVVDGCEVDSASDAAHCGGCGNACTYPHATPTCVAKSCALGACDAHYADCDKSAANGCEAFLPTSIGNCGACGNDCTVAYPRSTVSCVGTSGTCQWNGCSAGYVDLKSDHSCSYQCTFVSSVDLPDLGIVDANCDGIDGDPTLAIFVSPRGNDANPGTMASPKQTLAAALSAAAAASPAKNVYAAFGNYNESVTMISGIGVYGGYDDTAGWARARSTISAIVGTSTVGVTVNGATAATELQLMSVYSQSASGYGASSYAVRISGSSGSVTVNGCTLYPGAGSAGYSYAASGAAPAGAVGQPTGVGSGPGAGYNYCGGDVSGGGGGSSVSGQRPGLSGAYGSTAPSGGGGGSPGAGGSTYGQCGKSGTSGATGGGGSVGGVGGNGVDGSAASSLGGLQLGGAYAPADGSGAGGGYAGGGGGGGGSGGGNSDYSFPASCNDTSSGAGGGGGSGGCGGSGGAGGYGGGGSFGIVVASSAVTIESCIINMASGGAGGDGQSGGGGGGGGYGANGYGGSSAAGSGGPGGNGGRGGNGGGGSGGSGGPSICVFYTSASAPTYSKAGATTNACYLGSGGAFGRGAGTFNDGKNGWNAELQGG